MSNQDPVMTQITPFVTHAKPTKIKLVLLGESAVGKSSLVLRFVQKDYNENRNATIGAAFLSQKCYLEDQTIKFEIWDTAGQERFHSLAPMYYRNAQAAIVVYDLTQYTTFERAKDWVKELHDQAGENIIIALVGNKVDLCEDRQVTLEEASAYATSNNLVFHETSAKDTICVDEVFKSIGRCVPAIINSKSDTTAQSTVLTVDSTNTKATEKSCAC